MRALIRNVSKGHLNLPKSTQPLAPGDTGWLEITQELLDRRVDMGLYKVVEIGKKAEPAPQAPKKAAPKKAAPKKKKEAPRKPKPLAHSEPGKVPSLSDMLK